MINEKEMQKLIFTCLDSLKDLSSRNAKEEWEIYNNYLTGIVNLTGNLLFNVVKDDMGRHAFKMAVEDFNIYMQKWFDTAIDNIPDLNNNKH